MKIEDVHNWQHLLGYLEAHQGDPNARALCLDHVFNNPEKFFMNTWEGIHKAIEEFSESKTRFIQHVIENDKLFLDSPWGRKCAQTEFEGVDIFKISSTPETQEAAKKYWKEYLKEHELMATQKSVRLISNGPDNYFLMFKKSQNQALSSVEEKVHADPVVSPTLRSSGK